MVVCQFLNSGDEMLLVSGIYQVAAKLRLSWRVVGDETIMQIF